jgi:plasmid stabilization system protein ParE
MTGKRFRVVWTEVASQDLAQIALHVGAQSPPAAARLLDRLRDRASRLEVLPDRGRIVPELAGIGIRTYRELLSRPYRILYRRTGRDVVIVAVLDSRRDLEEVLFERLVRPGT